MEKLSFLMSILKNIGVIMIITLFLFPQWANSDEYHYSNKCTVKEQLVNPLCGQ